MFVAEPRWAWPLKDRREALCDCLSGPQSRAGAGSKSLGEEERVMSIPVLLLFQGIHSETTQSLYTKGIMGEKLTGS